MNSADFMELVRQKTGDPIEKVHLDELDQDVWVKKFNGAARQKMLNASGQCTKDGDKLTINQSYLISHCLVNEDGSRIFGDDKIDAIANLPTVVIDILMTKIFAVSGLKGAEELAKNSEPTPSVDSPSASLEASAGGTSIVS